VAVLGLRLSLKTYPDGDPLRDAAQRRLLGKLRAVVHALVSWHFEVSVTDNRDDLRAWDAVLDTRPLPTRVEAETQLTDVQGQGRRLMLKIRDGGPGPVVPLVAGTRANRAILETGAFADLFPLDQGSVLAALAEGRSPDANGIVVL
jgi:hypothetical protein